MKHLIRRLLGVLVTVLGAVPCAQWQQIPPVAEGDPIVHAQLTGNRLSLVDLENENFIMLPGNPVFDDLAPGVTGQVTLQRQPTGFDLIYTFTNTGTQPARMARLLLGKFNLGNNIHYRNFRHTGDPVEVDYNNYSFQGFMYPRNLYSPVWALFNEDYAIGISIQYPIMDYRHDARVLLGSTPANAPIQEGPRGWFIEYRLANLGGEQEAGRLDNSGFIPGGGSRTYVVSVRVTKNTDDWIRTFLPYRDYFRSMYGGVQYQRDARPIKPVLIAVNHLISENNPYGYDNFRNRRPDLHGWGPWAAALRSDADRYSRIMLWLPSGLYNENRQQNFPFQFTTQWMAQGRAQDVFDDDVGLPSVARAGVKLGLWWGRSAQVSRGWNSGQWEALDPENPAHVQACMAEMDLAVRAGATEIGLDTFNPIHTPVWKLVAWLERMRESYPGVKFCIEPVTCDVMHRLGSTYLVGWAVTPVQQESDLYRVNNPHYLADLLLPGHETWVGYSYHVHRANNYPFTSERVQQDMEHIAEMGYVPVMSTEPPAPENVRAAESWMTTLPADVLRGSGWNTNFSGPRAHRQSDGRLVIVNDTGGAPARPRQGNGRVGGATPDRPGGAPRGDTAPAGDVDAEPGAPAPVAPMERNRRKINGSISVQGGGVRQTTQTGPAEYTSNDLPGSHNSVSVPSSAVKGAKGVKGKVNSAWLEAMTRKGMLDRAKINQAVRKMHNSSGAAEPHTVVVPTNK